MKVAAQRRIAFRTLGLNPAATPPEHLIRRHYSRKHGPDAYYGNLSPAPTRSSPPSRKQDDA